MLTLGQARARRLETDWDNLPIPVPWFLGRRFVEPAIEDLIPFMKRTPALGQNAPGIAERLTGDSRFKLRGVYGFWPANSAGDDIVVYKDDARAARLVAIPMLRQQEIAGDGTSLSLADFVAPRESCAPDYIGAFAITLGAAAEELASEYGEAADHESAATTRAIADRFIESFAEFLHRQAREDWGYAGGESLSMADLFAGRYRGIRFSFGDPACPDESATQALLRLLHAPEIGLSMTESFAMLPAASVGGLYFAHPEARSFSLGRLGRDQIEDYATRKGEPIADVERRLSRDAAD